MAQPTTQERKNAYFNVRDIRDVNALNNRIDMDESFPSDNDERATAFVETLRETLNENVLRNNASARSKKQGLWSVNEIRDQLLNFLMGRQPMSVDEDGVKRIENTYGEDHSKDVRMPEDLEYIPNPTYNATPEAIIRLLKARSKGSGQERRV